MDRLSPQAVTALDTLGQYCSRGPVGTPQAILMENFGLSKVQSYQLLRESNATAEAFKRAMTYVPEQERIPTISRLTSRVSQKYEAASYEPSLGQFLGPPSVPSGPDVEGLGTKARSKIPPLPAGSVSSAERYIPFRAENYTSEASMVFSSMAVEVEGFGGIVFGNQVNAAPSLPHITAMSFKPGPVGRPGTIQVYLANNMSYEFKNVPLEDAYAAYHMTFAAAGGVSPAKANEGIGLVGLTDNHPSIRCSATTLRVEESSVFDVVMHPALAGTDLGWAAVMVDALPIQPSILLKQADSAGLGTESHQALDALFDSMHTKTFLHNWKVVDVPMTVTLEGNEIVVLRSPDHDGSLPEGLRRTAFIEMRPMLKQGEFDQDFATAFYQLVPVLTKGSYDYRRLNRFAAVLAIFRLAKSHDATFEVIPPLPPKVATPDGIRIDDDRITAAPQQAIRSKTGSRYR